MNLFENLQLLKESEINYNNLNAAVKKIFTNLLNNEIKSVKNNPNIDLTKLKYEYDGYPITDKFADKIFHIGFEKPNNPDDSDSQNASDIQNASLQNMIFKELMKNAEFKDKLDIKDSKFTAMIGLTVHAIKNNIKKRNSKENNKSKSLETVIYDILKQNLTKNNSDDKSELNFDTKLKIYNNFKNYATNQNIDKAPTIYVEHAQSILKEIKKNYDKTIDNEEIYKRIPFQLNKIKKNLSIDDSNNNNNGKKNDKRNNNNGKRNKK